MKKTKFKSKIFTVFALALLVGIALSFGALAASEADDATAKEAAEELILKEADENGADVEINFFEKLYTAVTDYISEILCVLAFGGSFLIAVLYKKGLLPLLKGALAAINTAVGRIKEVTESSAAADTEKTAEITEALCKAEALIEAQSDTLEALEKRLDSLSTDKSEREKLRLILESEVELLYNIFMSSGLPEYQKDAVAKRLKAISSFVKEDKEEA